jgi:uncharacterized protein YggL (DUF469 family)
MNKRLRKKKRVGEFKELGFELSAEDVTNLCARKDDEFVEYALTRTIHVNRDPDDTPDRTDIGTSR